MINTILFDLDGTLLPMDQSIYVRRYVRTMTEYYAERGEDPEKFQTGLSAGTLAAMQNQSELTNEEIFWKAFREKAGIHSCRKAEDLYRYYAEVHPTLCNVARVGRLSREPVDILKEKGYRLILATNPVFPRMATYQRMSWAGLVPDDFDHVSTWENSHRSKPHPDYFRELTDLLDLNPSECLVVGNDTRDDMHAGSIAGFHTWLVTDDLIDRRGTAEKYRRSTFADFVDHVRRMPNLRR